MSGGWENFCNKNRITKQIMYISHTDVNEVSVCIIVSNMIAIVTVISSSLDPLADVNSNLYSVLHTNDHKGAVFHGNISVFGHKFR